MAVKLQRPILVGGLGLTVGLWALDSLGSSLTDMGSSLLFGTIALGSGFLWWQRQSRRSVASPSERVISVNREGAERAIAEAEALLTQLAQELALPNHAQLAQALKSATHVAALQAQLAQIQQGLERTELRVMVLGNPQVGKTTLAKYLHSTWRSQALVHLVKQRVTQPRALIIQDAPSDSSQTASNTAPLHPIIASQDLVLFLTTGDLTDSDLQQLKQLLQQQQRVILVLNKSDHYLPDERPLMLQQIRQRVDALIAPEDVVAIAAQPAPIKVRQHQADGSMQETQEQPAPNLTDLSDRLNQLLVSDGQALLWGTIARQSTQLKAAILKHLNQFRCDRAMPLIEQSQWMAAAAAFANPVPSLDLLATAAITTQLVIDVGAIYEQKFSLDQAKEIAGTLATLMVKLGVVELTSQAIAPLLKGNALTYVAGGLMEGVSAAYLTRLAGLSLVAYFQEQSYKPTTETRVKLERLSQTIKTVLQDNQRTAFLQTLVTQVLDRLPSKSTTPALAAVPESVG